MNSKAKKKSEIKKKKTKPIPEHFQVKCNDCNIKIYLDEYLTRQGYCEECFWFKFPDGWINNEGYKVKRKKKKVKKVNTTLEALGIPKELWLPDNGIYINRFHVKSDRTDDLYVVSFNTSTNAWGCACPGWKSSTKRGNGIRKCKHLSKLNLCEASKTNSFASGYAKNPNIPTAGEIRATSSYSPMKEETSSKVEVSKRKISLD